MKKLSALLLSLLLLHGLTSLLGGTMGLLLLDQLFHGDLGHLPFPRHVRLEHVDAGRLLRKILPSLFDVR